MSIRQRTVKHLVFWIPFSTLIILYAISRLHIISIAFVSIISVSSLILSMYVFFVVETQMRINTDLYESEIQHFPPSSYLSKEPLNVSLRWDLRRLVPCLWPCTYTHTHIHRSTPLWLKNIITCQICFLYVSTLGWNPPGVSEVCICGEAEAGAGDNCLWKGPEAWCE